jgi:hypothetical protein
MKAAFSGSQAMRHGRLTRHQLRTHFEPVHPDVYTPDVAAMTIADRALAAVLWTKGRGVVAGATASALHGSRWVDDDETIELIWRNQHAPRGVLTRNERIATDEITLIDGLAVTTIARTALDLGRHLSRDQAVARLDALAHATGIVANDVKALLERYCGGRGARRARTAIALMDAGGTSPKETWLRLLLIDDGLPKPQAQLMVHNGDYYPLAYLDLAWGEYMVAVEYDGDQHRKDRRQYLKDITRLRMLERLGWIVIRVVAEDHPLDVLVNVRTALASRGYRET